MRKLNYGRKTELQPWQVFDLMGGTSTGGLIAMMLGRLRMSLDECQKAYLELSKKCFTPARNRMNLSARAKDKYHVRERFKSKELTDAIITFLREKRAETELLKDDREGCKVFVTTVIKSVTRLKLLRSYNDRNCDMLDINDTCKIWQACRATTAATSFFDEIEIGELGTTFTDGGLLKNNPIGLVLQEARILYGEERVKDAMILSIGTGGSTSLPVEGDFRSVINAMKSILTETRETHQEFCKSHPDIMRRNLVFRFDVDDQQLNNVRFHEVDRIRIIAGATEGYMGDYEVLERLERCSILMSEYFEAAILQTRDLINEGCAYGVSHMYRKSSECLEKAITTINWRHPSTTDKEIQFLLLDAQLKYTQALKKIKSPNSLHRANVVCQTFLKQLKSKQPSFDGSYVRLTSEQRRLNLHFLLEKAEIQRMRAAYYEFRVKDHEKARRYISDAVHNQREALTAAQDMKADSILMDNICNIGLETMEKQLQNLVGMEVMMHESSVKPLTGERGFEESRIYKELQLSA